MDSCSLSTRENNAVAPPRKNVLNRPPLHITSERVVRLCVLHSKHLPILQTICKKIVFHKGRYRDKLLCTDDPSSTHPADLRHPGRKKHHKQGGTKMKWILVSTTLLITLASVSPGSPAGPPEDHSRNAYRLLLSQVDANKDGVLSVAECMRIYTTQSMAEKNCTFWDADKDGRSRKTNT